MSIGVLAATYGGIMVLAAVFSYLLSGVACCVLKRCGIIDKPNNRSSHDEPTVRGGGMAIVASVLLGCLIVGWHTFDERNFGLALVILILAVVSFVDDVKTVSIVWRLVVHAFAAVAALGILDWPRLSLSWAPGPGMAVSAWLSVLITFLWLLGSINACNFMDGINGLAAGQAVVVCLVSVSLVVLLNPVEPSPILAVSAVTAGAAAGFLPYNFPRARMFMGDVSSTSLGFLQALLALWIAVEHGAWLLVPLCLMQMNFVLDAAITFIRRILRGDKWHEAHREHFYQRLVRAGHSHVFVASIELVLQGVVAGLMMLYVRGEPAWRPGLIVATMLLWCGFFAYCELEFRRVQPVCTA
jgi:UDP-N-acetylmuramyl pentapeptide phosphotransferase/UDP-N-acetylglucosamine-1-phosphate transferase